MDILVGSFCKDTAGMILSYLEDDDYVIFKNIKPDKNDVLEVMKIPLQVENSFVTIQITRYIY